MSKHNLKANKETIYINDREVPSLASDYGDKEVFTARVATNGIMKDNKPYTLISMEYTGNSGISLISKKDKDGKVKGFTLFCQGNHELTSLLTLVDFMAEGLCKLTIQNGAFNEVFKKHKEKA